MQHLRVIREDLTTRVARELRNAILAGDYRPGDRLPPERELATQLGVDRNTLRSAIQELEQLGLVERRQGSGCRVLDYRETATLDLIQYLVTKPGTDKVDPAMIESFLDVTRITFGGVVDLVVERADADDFAAVDAAVEALAGAVETDDLDGVVSAERRLVRMLFRASHSIAAELVLNTYEQVLDQMDPTGSLQQRWAGELVDRERIVLYRKAVDALESKNSKVAHRVVDQVLGALPEVLAAAGASRRTASPRRTSKRARSG